MTNVALHVERAAARKILGGVPERTFAALETDGVIVPAQRGRGRRASVYDLRTIVPAYITHVTSRAADDRAARTRKDTSVAELNELRLAKERRRVLPREQVLLEMQMVARAVTAKIRALVQRMLAAGLISDAAAPAVTALVNEALDELSGMRTLEELQRTSESA